MTTNKPKHTPGPLSPDDIMRVPIGGESEEAVANRRLFAAAPDMADALLDVLDADRRGEPLSTVTIDRARAALSRAGLL